MNEGFQRADPEERKADARAARDLLEDRIFVKAIDDLEKRLFGALMLSTTPEHEHRLVAQLQALKAIPAQLNSYINNEKKAEYDGRRRQ